MTLIQIIQILKQIALVQPNIKSATDGSIYEIMNTNPSVKYDVVHFSQTTHQSDEETDYYGLNIFYVSRLEDSLEDNRLQIQSIGKEILDNIIRTFCENWHIDFPIITYTPFTQKFNDLCAGCYCNLRLEIPKQIICADDYIAEVVPGSGIKLQDIGITITQNGLTVVTPAAEYDGIGEIRIVTDVPQASADLQYKEVEYTENGEYTVRPDPDYDGLTEVAVSVVVPDRYDEGYDDGKEDGIDEQKAKLESLSVSANGEYTRADGYSAITVDVPQYTGGTYQEGYEDGEAAQKAKLSTTSVTENGTYTRSDGYSAITVDVPQGEGYEEGYEDGEAAQKAKLVSTAVTVNGTYSREDGYSAITVNVPQGQGYEEGYEDGEAAQKAKLTVTSFTQNDTYTRTDGWSSVTINVDDRYDEGYDEGVADQKAKLVSTAVTENGTYSKPDGYSAITVNVDDRYNEGYGDGEAAQKAKLSSTAFTDNGTYTNLDGWSSVTVNSPWRDYFITGITLNLDSVIADIGTASTTFSPSSAFTDIYYTSSDPTIADIDSGTGVITAKTDGQVTICAIDRITHMQDCKQVSITRSSGLVMDVIYNVTSTTEPTVILNANYGYWPGHIVAGRLDDDTPIPISAHYPYTTTFTFPSTGLIRVHYTVIGDTLESEFAQVYSLVSAVVPEGITATNGHLFDTDRQLTGVTLPSTLSGTLRCFTDCYALTGITIPSGVTKIDYDCFYNCKSLSSVTIPSGVTEIMDSCFGYSFDEDVSLTAMTFDGTVPPTIHISNRSYGTPSLGKYTYTFPIYVPAEAYNDYITAPIWEEYAKKNRIIAKP